MLPNKKFSCKQHYFQKENNFEALAEQLSEDKKSARNGGSIGFFGINKYEKTFENAAFSIANDNEYTEPVKTAAGWHIIKRISKKGLLVCDLSLLFNTTL